MIPVVQAQEPPEFDAKVRQPGLSAIDEMVGRAPRVKRPGPRRKQIASQEQNIPAEAFPPYWRDALPDMLVAYERRCHRLCVQEREEYVRCYRLGPGAGGFDLAHLEYRAPFIASELRRRGQLVRGDT